MADNDNLLTPEAREAWSEAVDLFNAGEYFDCHEVIEVKLWRDCSPGPRREFYQGVLQVAVGLLHCQRQNWTGAKNLLQAGLDRLMLLAIDDKFLVPDQAAWQQFLQEVQGLSQEIRRCSEPNEANWQGFQRKASELQLLLK